MNTNIKIDFEMNKKKKRPTGLILYGDSFKAETHK